MSSSHSDSLDNIFPRCKAFFAHDRWQHMSRAARSSDGRALLESLLRGVFEGLPPYLPDLARVEWARHSIMKESGSIPQIVENLVLNPTVQALEVGWSGLAGFFDEHGGDITPSSGPERLLLWLEPGTCVLRMRPSTDEDLLVLKMIVENIAPEKIAALGKLPVGAVDAAVARCVRNGLLLAPPSRIRRDPLVFAAAPQELTLSPSFTLQWHITQVCDLHCKHCYDRSDRSRLTYDEALRVLDELRSFCRDRNVQGAVSFTGGNPLLHPAFNDIYRAALERNFTTAILGNPATRERIEEIITIGMPAFFQVSLEGLPDHNDSIRGAGHFDRIMAFLDVLRSLNVPSMVMLTLTSANMDQVIPLAGLLRGRTGIFHFNRLALFGEGANLSMPDRSRYRRFLEDYLEASRSNPVMGFKDNLINILRHERNSGLFGGCTGYGCGAAFNFVTLLPDGEVHACRKLPSFIGSLQTQSLAEIYDSDAAQRYRLGPDACRGCVIRAVCGGCLASAKSCGLDIFQDRDPFCFLPPR
jgi:selenobiotic family peptide radical SAM maturase